MGSSKKTNLETSDRSASSPEPKTWNDVEDIPETKLQKRLLTPFFGKNVPPIPSEDEKTIYPKNVKNFLTYFFFWWLIPLMNIGYKRTLQNEDLYALREDMKVKKLYNDFQNHLKANVEKAKKKILKAHPDIDEEALLEQSLNHFAVLKSLYQTFKARYIIAVICKCTNDTISSLLPLLTKELISFVEKKALQRKYGADKFPTNTGKGVGYAIGITLMVFAVGSSFNHAFDKTSTCGVQAKAIMIKAILDKSFKLDGSARQKFTDGKLTSMMTTDSAKLEIAFTFQPFLISFPIPLIISIALLVHNIGVAALAGIAVFIFIVFAFSFSVKLMISFRKRAAKATDNRVTLVREVLNSMKMIKFYSWETPYHQQIKKLRYIESKLVYANSFMKAILIAIVLNLPTFSSMVAFLVLHSEHPSKNVADIFASLTLFQSLATAVMMMPLVVSTNSDAFVTFKRVAELFRASEIEEIDNYQHDESITTNEEMAIQVVDADFEWDTLQTISNIDKDGDDREQKKADSKGLETRRHGLFKRKKESDPEKAPESDNAEMSEKKTPDTISSKSFKADNSTFTGLHNVNLEIKKGEFVMLTGPIGCGKSSLLNALAGIMKKTRGHMQLNQEAILCGYPWIQNATVKENILFGKPFDAAKYKKVIDVCCLNNDLALLRAGDMTEIGERGITLSGGQKARINLARSIYHDSDTIFLDDVLSAVDAKVGKQIMQNCFLTYAKDKTRILATHQLSFAHDCDRVIFISHDGHVNIGQVDELQANHPEFKKLMEFSRKEEKEVEEDEEGDEPNGSSDLVGLTLDEEKEKMALGRLGNDEERGVNSIGFGVYSKFLNAAFGRFSTIKAICFIFLVSLFAFCNVFTNTWLSFWTENKFPGKSTGFYMGIYIMFTFLTFFIAASFFIVLSYVCMNASRKLNLLATERVLHTPSSFTDSTPMGRILNRFTKDTDAMDNELVDSLRMAIFPLSVVIAVIILCIIYLPWIAIAVPPLGLLFVSITSYYNASAREIKRLESVNRSLVYNNFNECLSGHQTIRAYNLLDKFIDRNDEYIDAMNASAYLYYSVQRFLGLHLDMIACLYLFLISMLCAFRVFQISASSVGLLLSYSLQIVGLLSMIIREITDVENKMNSAERLIEYAYDLPQEPAHEKPDSAPHPDWPSKGEIVFDKVNMRYRENTPLVLNNLSFNAKPGEKVGICGRTGAGKSSIMVALYRLSELDSGCIKIDDVDISKLGLHDLRSKLSIIPQDPVLFRGTIRKNLDPFGDSNDEELWSALEKGGLIASDQLESVKKQHMVNEELTSLHKFHLDQEVQEEGSNFSLGERQLLALARALVRRSKILILDEATSSVDFETDAMINKTIRTRFKECTILCIAHRLNTISRFDKVMVLDKGSVIEFDKPLALYETKGSVFREMCDKANLRLADFSD